MGIAECRPSVADVEVHCIALRRSNIQRDHSEGRDYEDEDVDIEV